MTRQESIRRILRESVNESTFFRRRVDMELFEKEFFENLNIITDVYLSKYNEGVDFNFETFKAHAIDYFIDNYYNDLTNYGENDYPHDEIHQSFSNYFHNKIKDKYDTFFGNNINKSVDKSEDKKLELVTKMIHEFFDEVSFIDIKKYENKPMIRVYFDNDEAAGNEETYFAEQIQDKVYEYTGIKLIPYWHTIQYNTDADFRLDAIKLKYDNEGNVINESENKKQSLLQTIKKEGLYDFMEMSGLSPDDMKEILIKSPSIREILKQYIRDFVLINGNKWGDNSGILGGLSIQLSKYKYVEDIEVLDIDGMSVEIMEFDVDQYGYKEQKEQYMTSINTLTNEELLIIFNWLGRVD